MVDWKCTPLDYDFFMPGYVRWYSEGATYFFTIVTENRAPLFRSESNRDMLRRAIERCREVHSFTVDAMVLLPEHLHVLMTLPKQVDDFSTRIRWIKSNFTREFLAQGQREQPGSESRIRRGNRGVWQRRFYEHLCRDEEDVGRHVEYIHFNPVKHGLAKCPHEWRFSTFNRWVAGGQYPADWYCSCEQNISPPNFDWTNSDME